MFKPCACALVTGLLMMSCTSVNIQTVPSPAQIHLADGTVTDTPYTLSVPFFLQAAVNISRQGFADETLLLERFPTGERTIRLKPIYSISSKPSDASVTLCGKLLGKTPLHFSVPDQSPKASITVAKQGYLPHIIDLPAKPTQTSFDCQLEPDGPGRHAFRLMFTPYGFPIIRQVHDCSLELDRKPEDKAVRLMDFPPHLFPAHLTPIHNSPNLLVAILQQKNSQGSPQPLASIMLFSAHDATLAPFTPGQYFEISATSTNNSVFYSSIQTGRFDLWSCSRNPQPQSHELVLSNNQVKCQLTARENDMLFTAFNPKSPQDPRIWIASIDRNYLTDMRELCNGEQPTWPHAGRTILFQKTDGEKKQCWFPKTKLWAVVSDGSLQRQLSDHEDCIDKNPAWTKDDKHIIFSSNRNQKNPNNFNLWIMDANGKNLRQLTQSSAIDDFPMPTSDGKAVIFRSNRKLTWGLWKISLP